MSNQTHGGRVKDAGQNRREHLRAPRAKNSFGYNEDCGRRNFIDVNFVLAACFGILALIACGAWVLFMAPEQEAAIQKKICERSGGHWALDHWEKSGPEPARRIYGCVKDKAQQ